MSLSHQSSKSDDQPSWINLNPPTAVFAPKPIQAVKPLSAHSKTAGPTLTQTFQARVNSGRDTRSWNKILRPIMESKGIPYGPDREGDALVSMFNEALQITETHVSEVIGALQTSRKVSLCFLVDATGSMQPHIEGVRKYIRYIVDQLLKSRSDPNPRLGIVSGGKKAKPTLAAGMLGYLELAYVAYRDFGDEARGLYEIFDFSTDVAAFQRFASKIVAFSGPPGDICEHALGGIEKSLSLNWNNSCGTKMVFHIADAPCHGKKFHDFGDPSYDVYADGGVPGAPDVDSLFEDFQNRNILYYFGEITPHTRKMIKVFSESYGDVIKTYDIKDPINILDAVVDSVTASVGVNMAASKSGTPSSLARTIPIIEAEPDWSCVQGHTVSTLTYDPPALPADFGGGIDRIVEGKPLNRSSKTIARVKIAPNPFAAGSERLAYYGLVKSLKVVFKESKWIGRGHDSAFRYEQANEMQTVSSFLALEFNRILRKTKLPITVGLPHLKFLKVKTVSFPAGDGSYRILSQENYIQNASKFVRFTNNASYVLSPQRAADAGITYAFVELVMAFCHWTHHVTRGFLMIVDLEGCLTNGSNPDSGRFEAGDSTRLLLLTDPAIHCVDPLRYAPLNFGKQGFDMFFKDHKCNKFCQALKIKM